MYLGEKAPCDTQGYSFVLIALAPCMGLAIPKWLRGEDLPRRTYPTPRQFAEIDGRLKEQVHARGLMSQSGTFLDDMA